MFRIYLLLLIGLPAVAQPKFEVQEYTGTVLSFEPGFAFAYEGLKLNVAGTTESFLFYPEYGKLILGKLKPGDPVTLKVNLNLMDRQRNASLPQGSKQRMTRDYIAAFKIGNEWIELPEVKDSRYAMPDRFKMFLECEVKAEFWLGRIPMAFVFGKDLAGHSWYQHTKTIRKGDVISFLGSRYTAHPGLAYPISDVKEVYRIALLLKNEGVIKSLLFKQNYACIGAVVKIKGEELKLSFPSNFAERIKRFSGEGQKVTLYYDEYPWGNSKQQQLHAVALNGDTLKIEQPGFYGGDDIKHDHKPATVAGKVTKVNESDKGKLMSIILNNEFYIEIDDLIERQLGNHFTRGKLIGVSGDERIKADGEIYSKDYRIITPRSITIDGKSFLLTPQP